MVSPSISYIETLPHSPLYDPSLSPSLRLREAIQRSHSRAQRLSDGIQENKNAVSMLVAGDAQYLIRFFVGVPEQEVVTIFDTGSGLIWMQCEPCKYCHPQPQPIFDPHISDTYTTIYCDNYVCTSFLKPLSRCNATVDTCNFIDSYSDNSYALGEFASDTFTFNSTTPQSASYTPIFFGCATENIPSHKYAGIAGLDNSPYCLVSSRSSLISKLHFGADAEINVGASVSRTPINRQNPGNFYYLTLEAVSVEYFTHKLLLDSETSSSILAYH